MFYFILWPDPAPLKGPLVEERRTTNHSLSCRFIIFLIMSIGPAVLFLQIKGWGKGFYIRSALSGSYPNIPPNKDIKFSWTGQPLCNIPEN